MPDLPAHPWVEVIELGDVTILRFTERRMRDEHQIRQLSGPLDAVAADPARQKLIVNLADVDVISSSMVGKLIALQKLLNARGGRLVLCGLSHGIARIFEIGGLRRIFQICDDQAAAILAVAGLPPTPLNPMT